MQCLGSMYGMSTPSLHRESADSLIMSSLVYFDKVPPDYTCKISTHVYPWTYCSVVYMHVCTVNVHCCPGWADSPPSSRSPESPRSTGSHESPPEASSTTFKPAPRHGDTSSRDSPLLKEFDTQVPSQSQPTGPSKRDTALRAVPVIAADRTMESINEEDKQLLKPFCHRVACSTALLHTMNKSCYN